MHRATIHIDPTGAAPIGFAQAAGMPGYIRFDFKTQGNAPFLGIIAMHPQLVLRPFTATGAYAYDINIDDPAAASGLVDIPGSVMNDRFSVEVYERDTAGGPPFSMLAVGRIDLTGYAYRTSGPLGPATYSTGPSGPAGPAGAPGSEGAPGSPGERGSRWYTGAGAPAGGIPDSRVVGDMYLNETNGDVWRWDGSTWTAFKGV